jgi:TRAP-type mannitol/chloroaromatic compound transport system permease small subunit
LSDKPTFEDRDLFREPAGPGLPDRGIGRYALLVSRAIDNFTRYTAYVFASLTLILMLIIVHNVIMRYAFRSPTVWAYDLSYMLYGSAFMLGAAVALLYGAHVRTDFLYQRWSQRTQGIVDTFLYLVLFFPAMYLFFDAGVEYAARSWRLGERGFASTWRPVIYPLKTVIPVAIALLMIQGVSETIKSLYAAITGRWPPTALAHESPPPVG